MSHRHAVVLVVLASALTLAVSVAHADVFNMPTGQTSLSFVTVGDPGNAAGDGNRPATARSIIPYQMGEYDVTVGQSVRVPQRRGENGHLRPLQQLHGPAPVNGAACRPSGLHRAAFREAIATRSAAATPKPPTARSSMSVGETRRGSAIGCKTASPPGAEGPGTTETGAYTLNGDTTNLLTETRNAGATYFIPSENEWYKAAYYRG